MKPIKYQKHCFKARFPKVGDKYIKEDDMEIVLIIKKIIKYIIIEVSILYFLNISSPLLLCYILVIFINISHSIYNVKRWNMDKKLPSIFKNELNKKIDNNKNVFYSRYESIGNVLESVDTTNGEDNRGVSLGNSLDELLKNNQFIFNVPVEITTKEEVLNTKIVSKVSDHLLTSSGKVINLEDILLVKFQEK